MTTNFLSTFIDSPDHDFHPPCFKERGSVLSLLEADFQESHVSPPSSVDLFRLTARPPPPEVQVVIQVLIGDARKVFFHAAGPNQDLVTWHRETEAAVLAWLGVSQYLRTSHEIDPDAQQRIRLDLGQLARE